ncbi:primase-associated protein [Saliphagus infecundisoli]|uniref:Primase-associated protein n=1 Tax=Saliphagus infecundisoli TaxID=1849069 RepID=A0ABD5QKI5_9EURY|nr:primase-associated protein [Saliphagus infecundisoli]
MVDPRNTTRDAYLIAAIPTQYTTSEIVQLFARGYDRYLVDGEPDPETVLSDVERFVTGAFEPAQRERTLERSFVDRPATLVLLATIGTICVMEHFRFENTPVRRNQVIHHIRELFANNLLSLIREYDDPTLYQDIAEVLYGKPPSEDGPHPGRVCTDVTTMSQSSTDGFDDEFKEDTLYIEIPMAAASRACLTRTTDEATSAEETGEIRTQLANNSLYIPIEDFETDYQEYAETGFSSLRSVQEDELGEDERSWLTANETAISDRIERAIRGGHYEKLWQNWDQGQRLVRLLRSAISASPNIQVGEFHTSKELYDALEAYDPETNGEEAQLRQLSNHRSVAKTLANNESHQSITIERSGRVNTYQIAHSSSGARPIEVDDLEDLFELPCLAALDERLQEEKPVRKDLFNIVRMVMWLPQYQDASLEETIDDLQNLFSRWPWHDPEITEYQIKYEARRGERGIGPEGTTPLPMNCDNDDMQRYCIGQDQCPYSIYGSLPFPDDMYDQLDGNDDWF